MLQTLVGEYYMYNIHKHPQTSLACLTSSCSQRESFWLRSVLMLNMVTACGLML